MKRVLLLVSLLLGSSLYAQNTGSRDEGGQNAPADPNPPRPWAQVTVTPGPQGPVVNSYISPWPLGTALQDGFSQGLPLQDLAGNSVSPQSAGTQEPPPESGAVPAAAPPRSQTQPPAQPPGQTRQAPQAQSPVQGRTSAQPAVSPSAPSSRQSSKRVVIPSPIHYDRAGRRVVDPDWQDTLTQIVRSEREAANAAAAAANAAAGDGTAGGDPAANAGNAAAGNGTAGSDAAAKGGDPGDGTDAQPAEPVRETVIVVPGPAKWRIRGTLTVAKGMLALEDDDGVLWYLPGLDRYIGFIDGLDAGEEAILEGYAPALGSSQERYFQPTMLSLDEMDYDLSIPPYGLAAQPYLTNPGGQTLIREAAPAAGTNRAPETRASQTGTGRDSGSGSGQRSRDRDAPQNRRTAPQPPAWQHNHTSPWAPPASVLDFEMDYDSFWQEDPAKQERREQDSREIWY